MTNPSSAIAYRDAMVNYYVNDVEGLAAFYCKHFGLVETFRTPESGPAVHIEVRLGHFSLGLTSIPVARTMHHLPLNPGLPRGEIALWTDNVDGAYATLIAQGMRSVSAPHNFLETPPLRAAWIEDPEGNPIQLVCIRK